MDPIPVRNPEARRGRYVVAMAIIVLIGATILIGIALTGCGALHVSGGNRIGPPTESFMEPVVRGAEVFDARDRAEGVQIQITIPYRTVRERYRKFKDE